MREVRRGHSDRSGVAAALAVRPRVSVTVAVTLCVVIEQLLVTVTATETLEVDPVVTAVPRTATASRHGTAAPDAVTVTLTWACSCSRRS